MTEREIADGIAELLSKAVGSRPDFKPELLIHWNITAHLSRDGLLTVHPSKIVQK